MIAQQIGCPSRFAGEYRAGDSRRTNRRNGEIVPERLARSSQVVLRITQAYIRARRVSIDSEPNTRQLRTGIARPVRDNMPRSTPSSPPNTSSTAAAAPCSPAMADQRAHETVRLQRRSRSQRAGCPQTRERPQPYYIALSRLETAACEGRCDWAMKSACPLTRPRLGWRQLSGSVACVAAAFNTFSAPAACLTRVLHGRHGT